MHVVFKRASLHVCICHCVCVFALGLFKPLMLLSSLRPPRMKRRLSRDREDRPSSCEGPADSCKRVRQPAEDSGDVLPDWARLPQEILLHIFQYLPLLDRAFASQVCRGWNEAFHMPELWRCFEFELNQPASSYLKATHPDLIKQIIKRHSNHLQYVSFKVRGSRGRGRLPAGSTVQLTNQADLKGMIVHPKITYLAKFGWQWKPKLFGYQVYYPSQK